MQSMINRKEKGLILCFPEKGNLVGSISRLSAFNLLCLYMGGVGLGGLLVVKQKIK